MEEKEFRARCNHCNNKTILQVIGGYVFSTYDEIIQVPDYYNRSDETYDQNVSTQKTALLLKCSVCKQPIFAHRVQHFYKSGEEHLWEDPFDEYTDKEETIGGQIETIHPPVNESKLVPQPNKDMPPEIISDYEEAKNIFQSSPRACAAILRLAIQKLCKHFGLPGINLKEEITTLEFSKGIVQALTKTRMIGDDSVRPGELNPLDNVEIATSLFKVINLIVTEKITNPKEIKAIYSRLRKR